MSNINLYYNCNSGLTISNQELRYEKRVINFTEVKSATAFQIKANDSSAMSLGLMGIVFTLLGKFRAGLNTLDLLRYENFLLYYNLWDVIGGILILISAYLFTFLQDSYYINLEMKSGSIIQIQLHRQGDQNALDEINDALQQALRYSRFSYESRNPYEVVPTK